MNSKRQLGQRGRQYVRLVIACWITSVTTAGWEIMITWDPSISVIVAPAR